MASFTTVPEDLFFLTFNDPKVGIDDIQMRMVKEALKILLPEIAGAIDNIPENSNQIIGDVGFFIRLALFHSISQ